MSELFQYSASDVVDKLKSGEVSIQDTLDSVRSRIEAVDGKINSLPTLCFDRAAEHAKHLQSKPVEQRGKLCGLPVTIKDLSAVAGVRTTNGSAVFKDNIPTTSNKLVTRIERHGGIVYAKSNTPEFGAGGITFNDVFGITRTPYDITKSSAGSSGGAAASLAAGCAWASHGSDMAGSLRTPASFCGVTSLRPSPFTIRADSAHMPFDVLGEEGPMARSIGDLALFADAMRNGNSDDMTMSLQANELTSLSKLSIAYSHDLGITEVADDVAELFQGFVDQNLNVCTRLKQSAPALPNVHESFDVLRANFYAAALEPIFDDHRDVFKPEVVWNVEQGLQQTSKTFREAQRSQAQIVNLAAEFMRDFDVLICPAVSRSSVAADVRYPGDSDGVPIPEYYRWLAIAYASTMTTLPIITIPVGETNEGLPFAVQLIGKPWGDAALFPIARLIEQMVGRNNGPIDPK